MKNVFKAKTALMLVMVAAILTGCGKSKNDGGVVVGGVGTTYPGGWNGSTLVVSGDFQLSNASHTTYNAAFGNSGVGSTGGASFSRPANGDGQLVLFLPSGLPAISPGYSQMSGTVVVNFTAAGTAYFQQCGEAPAYVYLGTVQLINGQISGRAVVVSASQRCGLYF